MPDPAGALDANDYRKRVLAAVERRGGPDTSDVFELYDLPPDEELPDQLVTARVAEVWGLWQRHRDHPKYRVLVGQLVETHELRSAELLDPVRRRVAARRVRAERELRDAARYELLDAAIARLVDRHGGLPRDKIQGLDDVGALGGLTPAEVAARVRRHRIVEGTGAGGGAAAEPGVSPERRRQVGELLAEFGRLTDAPPPATLLSLLGLDPTATPQQVPARAAAWRGRAREMPPGRLRAVVDELLVHVADLLEQGRDAVERYLDAVALDVTERLRPRVRAAVLVEDRVVAEDHAHLLAEAIALGLDRRRATAVLAALAQELGTTIDAATGAARAPDSRDARAASGAGTRDAPPAARGDGAHEGALRAARRALREGRAVEAQRLAREAERVSGPHSRTPVRAVVEEIEAVLAEAAVRWRAALAAADGRRFAEAVGHLEHLHRTAVDLRGEQELTRRLDEARAAVGRADRAAAAAAELPAADRARALLAVLAEQSDNASALAALAEIPVLPPGRVTAVRSGGAVLVSWSASSTPDSAYKVTRLRPDGRWQVVGRALGTTLEDGGAPTGGEVPVYAVVATQAGRSSAEARSDDATPGSARIAPDSAPADAAGTPGAQPAAEGTVAGVRARRTSSGSVMVSWSGPPGAEFRVRCEAPDGRWRVVGRTRETTIEDGGAPPGPPGVYAVSAAVDGVRSAETRSTG